jgi:hypothetical protein
MIERNTSVKEAVKNTRGVPSSRADVNNLDLDAIQKLLSTISGFKLWNYHFYQHREDRLIEAIVPGTIGDRQVNAYLIRLPNEKWMLVETVRM